MSVLPPRPVAGLGRLPARLQALAGGWLAGPRRGTPSALGAFEEAFVPVGAGPAPDALAETNAALERRLADQAAELAQTAEALRQETALRRQLEAERDRLVEQLRELSETDGLTGALNRRGFAKFAEREFQRTARTGQPLSLIALDLDHFRQVNDEYGEAAGDLVLGSVGRLCRKLIRDVDLLARFDGQTFVILLVDATEKTAWRVAERLHGGIAVTRVPTPKGEVTLTASLGVVTAGDGPPELEAMLRLAKHRLRAAKSAGRNCIRTEA